MNDPVHDAPTPPDPGTADKAPPARKRSTVRNAIQLLGFGVGIGLLIWCVREVLSEDNRAALERLRDASAWEILLMLSVAASSIVLNAVIFWATIRPLHKIRVTDMIATNALCTFLSYLPFKISVIARWLIHGRRDGVPALTIGTWFLVVVGLMAVTIVPLGLAFVRPSTIGWSLCWVVILCSVAASHWFAMAAARWLRGERGLRRLRAMRVPSPVLEHDLFRYFHDGAAMAGDGHATWISAACRVLDIGGFTLRIGVAASILGVNLTVEDTMLIGLAYFVAGVVSPFGSVGAREGAALGLALGAGVVAAETQQAALITAILLVTVTDAMTSFIGAGFGLAWLRADRLLPGRSNLRTGPDIEAVKAAEGHTDEPTMTGEDRTGTAEPDRR